MNADVATSPDARAPLVARVAPGLATLLGYRRDWLRHDVVAGLSVAAVALPTAIAYAQIIGFDPVVGLYAAILPLVVYCLLGTSRHLIVNPDAATCALIAGTLAPLAGDKPNVLLSLSVGLALFTGLICIAAGLLRLGFVADFLSRPILVGFLNGVAIHIFLGQLGKVFGFAMESHGIIPSLLELLGKLHLAHVPTLIVGLLSIGVMLAGKRFLPRWPAPLLAVIFAVVVVRSLGLESKGVAVVGQVPAGLPPLAWPEFDLRLTKPLLGGAMGVALLSYTNAMVVARSFAAKNVYEVDANREFFALGASQIAAALSGGFAVSGTESRTAMNHAMGGKSPLAGLVAAGVMAAVLLFFTGPLSYLPQAALGAVLIVAAIGLFDAPEIVRLWRISRWECALAIVTTLGVVALDVLDGILLAVGLALLIVLIRTSRPPDAVLGRAPGLAGFHNVAFHAGAETLPGLVLYRFGSALWFFNAAHFKRRALVLATAHRDIRWLIVDGAPIGSIDSTGAQALRELADELARRDIKLGLANIRSEVRALLDRAGVTDAIGEAAVFPSLESAVDACQKSA
ncbi:MAG: sulfate permease [Planctomycetaceae bacterium]|nr:sulfate permease [Planctomycetaceae bacterium]